MVVLFFYVIVSLVTYLVLSLVGSFVFWDNIFVSLFTIEVGRFIFLLLSILLTILMCIFYYHEAQDRWNRIKFLAELKIRNML